MTDEAIEGWALMLTRDPKRILKLEHSLEQSDGLSAHGQRSLPSSFCREPTFVDSGTGTGTEESEGEGGTNGNIGVGRGSAGRGGHAGERRRGRGKTGGKNVVRPSGDHNIALTRHKKDANKASQANHNRRDQRAKKIARSGL
jgi:activating signal cointegrator complex subunit 2